MEGSSSGFILKKKPRIRNRNDEDEQEGIDRLSDLPDCVINHILSFIDTKFIVQTSVLSKRWTSLWKDVNVLKVRRNNFRNKSSFMRHVHKFLSHRSDSIVFDSISLDFGSRGLKEIGEILDSIMRCSSSSKVRHLSVFYRSGLSRYLAHSIDAYGHYESLEILELKEFRIDYFEFMRFKLLSTLELHHCSIGLGRTSDVVDPLTNLPPCLKHLKLLQCGSLKTVQISAPQLLDLEIQDLWCQEGIELFAPMLKSFDISVGILQLRKMKVYRLNFPSLAHANIRLWQPLGRFDDHTVCTSVALGYVDFLRGLHNAESLTIHYGKLCQLQGGKPWKQHHFLFGEMRPEASPFTRLKTLRMQFPQEPPSVPNQVIRYFFGGSSSAEGQSVKLERHNE
ncbi:F-box/FBD/LRR-repeat protein At4g00160 [Linum perenne]